MNRTVVAGVWLSVALSVAAPAADAAPMTMSFFCTANAPQSKAFYLTETFSATADVRDVKDAWQKYIAGKDASAKKLAVCQAGLDLESLQSLRNHTRDSSAGQNVVTVDWKYAEE